MCNKRNGSGTHFYTDGSKVIRVVSFVEYG
jgi:hypothetical protein